MNKNVKLFDSRYRQIVGTIIVLMIILGVRLFVITVLQHDEWTVEASDQNTKTIYTTAPRGNIYDRNGQPLALNKQTFTATFNASSLSTEEINASALTLMNTLIKNNDKYTDNFPIKIGTTGKFYYTYDVKKRNWLKSEGFPTNLTAKQAFDRLREKYNIDATLGRKEAMTVLQDKYKLDPPISASSMEYTYDQQKYYFLAKFNIVRESDNEVDVDISAEDCFKQLRENYSVDKKLSNKQARRIFIIRNEIAANSFSKYLPITVASNVSNKTITYIEESATPGVEITSGSTRYYPNGLTACHILGYMGAISESEVEEYVEEKGYSASDLIGKDGLEASLEDKLHGTPGVTKIKVNSSGEYVETLSEEAAKKGSDVYTTIDLDLQKVTEKALKDAINKSSTSESGAAVAISIKTGEVLSLASYPGFDPNIFAEGISYKAWQSVQPSNPRDSWGPRPLFNIATNANVSPGSTFKPITAIAALESGLNPNASIVDRGFIEIGGIEWGCSSWNDYGGTHGSQTLEWGIGNSCNYYFFCIATGKDWGTGASLGYKQKISVDTLLGVAKQFGLGEKTGIELSESVLPLTSAAQKMESYRIGVWNAIYDDANKYFPQEVLDDDARLEKNISIIANWITDNPSYNKLISLIETKTEAKKSQVEALASMVKFDYFIQAQWGTGDQFNLSIGQGDNAYTPLQMANYVATLGNNGKKNQVSIVSGIEGEGKKQTKATKLDIKQSSLDETIKGMKRVCTSGTLAGVFSGFPVEVAGKTGTAENQGIRQPKSEVSYIKSHLSRLNSTAGTSVTWSKVRSTMEKMMDEKPEVYYSEDSTVDDALIKASNYKITQAMINSGKGSYEYNAWTIAMAPADDPQIAVAVLLIEGGYSSNAAPVTKEIIAEYLKLYDDEEVKVKKTKNTGKNKVQ